MLTDAEKLQQLLMAACAHAHGENGRPHHEVGDLQEILDCAWALLTPAQREAVYSKCEMILAWLD